MRSLFPSIVSHRSRLTASRDTRARRLKADPEAAERMAQQASKWIMEGQNK